MTDEAEAEDSKFARWDCGCVYYDGTRVLRCALHRPQQVASSDTQTTFGHAHFSVNHGNGTKNHPLGEPLVQMDWERRDPETGKRKDVIKRFGVPGEWQTDLTDFMKPAPKPTLSAFDIRAKEREERILFEENSNRILKELFRPKVDLHYKPTEYKPFDMLELPKPWLSSFEKDTSIDNSVLSMYDERRAKEKKDALMFSTYVDPLAQRLAEMKLNSMESALDRLDNLPGRICGAARPYLPLDQKKPWL
jgi:hypothetical protein